MSNIVKVKTFSHNKPHGVHKLKVWCVYIAVAEVMHCCL